MGIIFVAGVHAVGKSIVCSNAAISLGLPYYSASTIIKSEKNDAISNDSKVVADVDRNQSLLIRGVQKILEQNARTIIIDGHFTLLTSDGDIEPISVEVYRSLFIESIVVFYDRPRAIAQRLAKRDNTVLDPDIIDRHQRFELKQAKLVAIELNISINLLKAFDESEFIKLIAAHQNSNHHRPLHCNTSRRTHGSR